MKTTRLLLFLVLLTGTVLTGCDTTANDDEDEGMTMLTFDLEAMVGTSHLHADANHSYTVGGRAMTITAARFYLSEITLLAEDGSEYMLAAETPVTVPAKDADDNDVTHTVENKIVLTKHEMGMSKYHLGEAPSGRYTGLRFKIGIDGLDNRVDPSQVPADHPLAKQTDRNNHWSWNAGYIFLRMDGLVDADDDGTPESGFEVHLGSADYVTVVEQDLDFTLDADMAQDLHVIVDYAKFIDGVDYGNVDNLLCHTFDNPTVASKVGGQLASAFMFHGVHLSEGDGHMHN